MADTAPSVRRRPTRIDRYPAKMIAQLADRLIDQYATDANHIVDPFCGSGAVIEAAHERRIKVSGVDLNPFAVLLSQVKLDGFEASLAMALCQELLEVSRHSRPWHVRWENVGYWFTDATLRKIGEIREAARRFDLPASPEGRAVLLALGLSVRLCSRADQRSPKPFVSKIAIASRRGKHFDPRTTMCDLLVELGDLYGQGARSGDGVVVQRDLADPDAQMPDELTCSHVITSPPYANAQDYFRNFKLELYVLEGLLGFEVCNIAPRFVGTERGLDRRLLTDGSAECRRDCLTGLDVLEKQDPRKAVVLHRYLSDMETAFLHIQHLLRNGGTLVLVCGDNLIAGKRFETWAALNRILERLGFGKFDSFPDCIRNRALAPKRKGHQGMIKQEIVSAFRLEAYQSNDMSARVSA